MLREGLYSNLPKNVLAMPSYIQRGQSVLVKISFYCHDFLINFRTVLLLPHEAMLVRPAFVAEWLTHSAAMCSRA